MLFGDRKNLNTFVRGRRTGKALKVQETELGVGVGDGTKTVGEAVVITGKEMQDFFL